jgi:hypothetical protein
MPACLRSACWFVANGWLPQELYIPSELAYGESKRGEFITPGAVLIFELEILRFNGRADEL